MDIYENITNSIWNFRKQTESPKNKIMVYLIPLHWMNFIAQATMHETTESSEIKSSHVMVSGKEPIQMEPLDQNLLKKIISNEIPKTNIGEIYFKITQTDENIGLFSSLKNSRGILLIKSHNSDTKFFQLGSERAPLNLKNMSIDIPGEEFKLSLGSTFTNLPFYAYTGDFPIQEPV